MKVYQMENLKLLNISPYFTDEELINKIKNKQNTFVVLSLKWQSLNAKIDQINMKLENLRNYSCGIGAICLQETWLSNDSNICLLQIDGFTLISQGKIRSAHGGLSIYLNNKYDYKILSISNVWEGQFIEITGNTIPKKIIQGNIYRLPRDVIENYNTFIDELTPILTHLQKKTKSEVITAGDFNNNNLLKIKEKPVFSEYFDMISAQCFFPRITLPTRFSEHRGTHIDNFFL